MSSQQKDYTSGSMVYNLWSLSWPMTLSMLLFTLPNFLDGIWLGKLGPSAVAAAGLAMGLRITMISPLMALSMAGGAVVARYVGARDQENADRATLHVVLLMLVSSGAMGIVGLVFKRPLLYLVGARDEVFPLAVQYVRVVFIGLIAMEMVPSLGGVFNAAGNPKVPLKVNCIVACSMIAIEPFLVMGIRTSPGLGITGASLAIVAANTFGTIYAFYILLTGRATVCINVHDLRFDGDMLWRIVKIALPALIHRGTPNLAQAIRLRLISAYGTVPLAAYNIVRRVVMLALIPCTALARVTGVMVGQNLGAGKPQRSEKAAYIVVGVIAVIAVLTIISLSLCARYVMEIFFDKEQEVIKTGTSLIWILGIGQIFFTLNLAMETGLTGAADTISPMIISIVTLWLIQLPLIYLLSRMMGLGANGIWIALIVSPLIQYIITTLRFRQGRWKLKKI